MHAAWNMHPGLTRRRVGSGRACGGGWAMRNPARETHNLVACIPFRINRVHFSVCPLLLRINGIQCIGLIRFNLLNRDLASNSHTNVMESTV